MAVCAQGDHFVEPVLADAGTELPVAGAAGEDWLLSLSLCLGWGRL